ncbi:hypothetical protein BKI52_31885 [marine bacterium AO1-C]|nr:hypothetical protein BKI52_31885 [marine bacterium AO1-C]
MKTYKTLINTVVFGVILSFHMAMAQSEKANFESYLKSFKTIPFSDITQKFLEGNPYKEMIPMTTPEALQWVVRPCIFVFSNNDREGSQNLGQSLVDEIEEYSKSALKNKRIRYYKYGRVNLSDRYVSLLYFYLKEGLDLQCLLINYSKKGKTIDGLVIGKADKNQIYAAYEVDITQVKPQNTLHIRNLSYKRDKEGRAGRLNSEVDHYYQIQKNGRVLSVQSQYYPLHGFFKDRRGNSIKISQNQHWTQGKFSPKSGYGLGAATDAIKKLTIGKAFKIKIDKKEYQAVFTNKNKIKLTGPDKKNWVFSRRRKK